MQLRTANYRHLCSPVYPLMFDDNNRSYILKVQAYLSNVYDLLLLWPPNIKGLKSIYVDHYFVTLHWMPLYAYFLHKVFHDWLNKIPENCQVLKGNFECSCYLVIFLLHFSNLIWFPYKHIRENCFIIILSSL